jgi:hypothetical protein
LLEHALDPLLSFVRCGVGHIDSRWQELIQFWDCYRYRPWQFRSGVLPW